MGLGAPVLLEKPWRGAPVVDPVVVGRAICPVGPEVGAGRARPRGGGIVDRLLTLLVVLLLVLLVVVGMLVLLLVLVLLLLLVITLLGFMLVFMLVLLLVLVLLGFEDGRGGMDPGWLG
jgi:hypothetical protein